MIREIDRSSWFHRYMCTWVELNAENGEFRAGNGCSWRKFIEGANEHQKTTDYKRCFKDAKEIIASEAIQDDSLLSVFFQCERGERSWIMKPPITARRCNL